MFCKSLKRIWSKNLVIFCWSNYKLLIIRNSNLSWFYLIEIENIRSHYQTVSYFELLRNLISTIKGTKILHTWQEFSHFVNLSFLLYWCIRYRHSSGSSVRSELSYVHKYPNWSKSILINVSKSDYFVFLDFRVF